ncbi:hypothetical protein [Lacipirellula parvula]|uniref:LSDAT prokaryote domain-containing protein n=1 Tax=Lacipirellula parvula TaxID=2650471 RepID=A0A5K7X6K4_9BACT|nr:hypothetical protein [Lacipirellula parvula]BBO32168.1 hypothetical protein PLANPX_1780 [Lacipirellula parvula]
MNPRIESELERALVRLAAGPRLAVIGSTEFWDAGSPALCEAIAGELAAIEPLVALTGGMNGVGQTFAEAYETARKANGLPVNLYHLLPHGTLLQRSGTTLGAGEDFNQRREVLGRAAQIYLVIEGGPGTEHEAAVATAHGAALIPVGRSGGAAGDIYPLLEPLPEAAPDDWRLLGERDVLYTSTAAAVGRIVRTLLQRRS